MYFTYYLGSKQSESKCTVLTTFKTIDELNVFLFRVTERKKLIN